MVTYPLATTMLSAPKATVVRGYSIDWSGQYEYMQRAGERLRVVMPITLAIIVLLLYLNFRRVTEVLIILGTLPLALVGGVWLVYGLDSKLQPLTTFIAIGACRGNYHG